MEVFNVKKIANYRYFILPAKIAHCTLEVVERGNKVTTWKNSKSILITGRV
jgi:hypothetical protein